MSIGRLRRGEALSSQRSPLHRLIEVADQIVGCLTANWQAYDVTAGAHGGALLVGELPRTTRSTSTMAPRRTKLMR
jgi:hypothetical protein